MFSSILQSTITLRSLLLCSGVSLLCGLFLFMIYKLQWGFSKSFGSSLIVLPVIIQAIIMMVNGNLGAGVAVMGVFSLVRFRSAPGSSSEITMIFLAMAAGLATGMGYILFALFFTILVGMILIVFYVLSKTNFKNEPKTLKIVIPETLDYENVFDDVLEKYTKNYHMTKVRTTNMGSLFELDYQVRLNKDTNTKKMIDELRCRNGNLAITLGRVVVSREEL